MDIYDLLDGRELSASEVSELAGGEWSKTRVEGMLSGKTGVHVKIAYEEYVSEGPDEWEDGEQTYSRYVFGNRRDYRFNNSESNYMPQLLSEAIDVFGDSAYVVGDDYASRVIEKAASLCGWSVELVELQGASQSAWVDMLFACPEGFALDDTIQVWRDYFSGDVFTLSVLIDDYGFFESVGGLIGSESVFEVLSEVLSEGMLCVSEQNKKAKAQMFA